MATDVVDEADDADAEDPDDEEESDDDDDDDDDEDDDLWCSVSELDAAKADTVSAIVRVTDIITAMIFFFNGSSSFWFICLYKASCGLIYIKSL